MKNPNYIKGAFPALNQTAERLFLEYEEDAELVIDLLGLGESLIDPSTLDVEGAGRVAAGYDSVSYVIRKGNPGAKMSLDGPEPIPMPSYEDVLTETEINVLIAYLVSLYDWEEEDEDWEEEE